MWEVILIEFQDFPSCVETVEIHLAIVNAYPMNDRGLGHHLQWIMG
ncbi:MAG: hypothetical protein ACKVT0_20065 [Planctomycetaceae bacterium]